MNPVKPKPEQFLVNGRPEELTFAENQPEYIPLPALRTRDGKVITQWELTPDEKLAIENGQPITLVLHMFDSRCPRCRGPLGLTPVILAVGGLDLT